MTKEYRELYREIVVKINTRKRISIEEIEKIIEFAFNEGYNQCMLDNMEIEEFAFNEGYNQCMLDNMEIEELIKENENERKINE